MGADREANKNLNKRENMIQTHSAMSSAIVSDTSDQTSTIGIERTVAQREPTWRGPDSNLPPMISRDFDWILAHQNRTIAIAHNFDWILAHQNRTIAIASDFRADRVKSPEIPQKATVLGSEIAA